MSRQSDGAVHNKNQHQRKLGIKVIPCTQPNHDQSIPLNLFAVLLMAHGYAFKIGHPPLPSVGSLRPGPSIHWPCPFTFTPFLGI